MRQKTQDFAGAVPLKTHAQPTGSDESMKICSKCMAENADDAKFCELCASPIAGYASRPGPVATVVPPMAPPSALMPLPPRPITSEARVHQYPEPVSKMEADLKVFISSTLADLKDYRQSVFDAILGSGLSSENMIFWSADERSPATVSVEKVRQSDVLVLLLAHRYGYVPAGTSVSITKQEYDTARLAGIPILAFLVDESVPWPPQHIEWEQRGRLAEFKSQVSNDLTTRTFKSADHLASLVSQALAGLKVRRQQSLQYSRGRSRVPAIQIQAAVDVKLRPDLNLHVGEAEDGLPLILKVHRSSDISSVFNQLEQLTSRPGSVPPTALLSSFRQLINEHALKMWASHGVISVRMRDYTHQEMLICRPTLSKLYRSNFASLFNRAERESRPAKKPGTVGDVYSLFGKELQSEGGSNRFLGISLEHGKLFSVGQEQQRGHWVEWRPFIFESLIHYFRRDAVFSVDGYNVRADLYSANVSEVLERFNSERSISISMEVPTQAVGRLLMDVALELAKWHSIGVVHGDVKAENILITAEGVVLIDDFKLLPGRVAPGWTPDWSAPEQALGEPVAFESDVYPVGCLLAELLGGRLVGEVRKFKAAYSGSEPIECDIFYNPAVRVYDPSVSSGWGDLARRCMRFRPDERPSASALAEEIKRLLEECPLEGVKTVKFPDNIVGASFMGGGVGPARVISVDMSQAST